MPLPARGDTPPQQRQQSVNHASCPDCSNCGGRLHCWHLCPNQPRSTVWLDLLIGATR